MKPFHALFLLILVSMTPVHALPLNWTEQDPNQYIENRITCQTAIEEFYWQQLSWPAENKGSKPSRDHFISDQQIMQKIQDSRTKEAALSVHFGTEITTSMVQNEIDRMVKETKDPKKLSQLFAVLDHDPVTIAECLARPQLAEKLLKDAYDWNRAIHQNTREKSSLEFIQFQAVNNFTQLSARVSSTRYVLQELLDQQTSAEYHVVAMEQAELERFHAQFVGDQVIEAADSFFVESIISSSDSHVEVERLSWPKQPLSEWLQQLDRDHQNTLQLPTALPNRIALSVPNNRLNEKIQASSTMDDSWETPQIPSPRSGHMAVWTGSEMLVFGGYDRPIGGKYNPITDTWSLINPVDPELFAGTSFAVWTGTHVIVWTGVFDINGVDFDRGKKYEVSTDSWSDIADADLNDYFSVMTAVWTGDQMLLFGEGNFRTFKGLKYDPSNNTWSEMSMAGAPIYRYDFTTVWTGNEMIIWGGSRPSSLEDYNTGGRYNPITDTWTATSTLNAPTARGSHTAVWTGQEMIIWGGEYSFQNESNRGGRYNPISNSWTPIALNPFLEYRNQWSNKSSVWTGTEMIVWGGGTTVPQNNGGIYNPSNDSWREVSMENAPREGWGFSTVWTGSEMIIWGGSRGSETNSGGRFNPVTNTWRATQATGGHAVKTGSSVIWTGYEMIVWGGYSEYTGLKYNPITSTWSDITSLDAPAGRSDHSAIWTGEEMIIWGGDAYLAGYTGAQYQPMSDTWSAMESLPSEERRYNHLAAWSGTEMFIWAGNGSAGTTGLRYNQGTDSWAGMPESDIFTSNRRETMVKANQGLLFWGGIANINEGLGAIFDWVNDEWMPMSSINAPRDRTQHAAVLAGDHMMVWGGLGGGGANFYLDTGGLYDLANDSWTATSLTNAPTGRHHPHLLWSGREVLVWGGSNGGNTGGRLNPETNSWSGISEVIDRFAYPGTEPVWTGEAMIMHGVSDPSGVGVYYPKSTYYLGGQVTGLHGGLSFGIQNGSFSPDLIGQNGDFQITRPLFDGENYQLSISQQPTSPNQTCAIANGTGQIQSQDINDILIECVTNRYVIHIELSGLDQGNQLLIKESSENSLLVAQNGIHALPQTIEDGSEFLIQLGVYGSTPQVCQVDEATGTMSGADITLAVGCFDVPDLIFVNGVEALD